MADYDQQPLGFQERRPKNARLRRGIFLLPSIFTGANLLCGYYASIAALSGTNEDFDHAAKAIGIAILFDALDGRVAIKVPEKFFVGRTRLAIRPYPAEWERQLQLAGDWKVAVRPMRPEDEPAIAAFLTRVSREDLRLRFFHAMKEFSHAFIARLTQLDYARAMAFVASDVATGDLIGAVRLHSDSHYETAEYAILLRSDMKGKGLGWALMQLLIEYARAEGLKRLTGAVLRDNATMLAMCRELGFEVKSDPRDSAVAIVSLDLDVPSPVPPVADRKPVIAQP